MGKRKKEKNHYKIHATTPYQFVYLDIPTVSLMLNINPLTIVQFKTWFVGG